MGMFDKYDKKASDFETEAEYRAYKQGKSDVAEKTWWIITALFIGATVLAIIGIDGGDFFDSYF